MEHVTNIRPPSPPTAEARGSVKMSQLEIFGHPHYENSWRSSIRNFQQRVRLSPLKEVKEATIPIKFSEINNLHFEDLPNLRSISSGDTVELPSLEHVIVNHCPILKKFGMGTIKHSQLKSLILDAQVQVEDDIDTKIAHIFEFLLSLDKLRELYIINKDVKKLFHYNCPSKSFCELENLTLSNNKVLSSISSSMIRQLINLKKLTLDKCELLIEVFNPEDDKPNYNIQKVFPQLKALTLSNLSRLKCLWNKEPQVPFFSNLVSLYIVHCGILKSLFSLSSVKNLGKLKLLKLHSCEKIKEVITNENHENVSIIFPLMECLVLKDLPKLVNFCQQNETLNWPNLQIVRAINIPSMETFSSGNLNTPLLRSVHITFSKKIWLGSLNNTISYMHKNPDHILSL
ncbi:uncharacterized protein LOC114915413 [Cajanus cajan]|uniref:uncharacterized protein LOC114915413 n=1 Tax=Cajanus cajan TaxID=3821 RepID=UPI0010FAD539|nr:uncharacterized protein LOC114915413 [Cajanus cajan]